MEKTCIYKNFGLNIEVEEHIEGIQYVGADKARPNPDAISSNSRCRVSSDCTWKSINKYWTNDGNKGSYEKN